MSRYFVGPQPPAIWCIHTAHKIRRRPVIHTVVRDCSRPRGPQGLRSAVPVCQTETGRNRERERCEVVRLHAPRGGGLVNSSTRHGCEKGWSTARRAMGRKLGRRARGRGLGRRLDAPRRGGLINSSTRHGCDKGWSTARRAMGRKLGRRAMENSHTCDRIQRGDEQFRATKRERWHTR